MPARRTTACLRAVAYGVVIETAGGHARALRKVRMLTRGLIVEALEQHRDNAAKMGHDILDAWIARRHVPGNEVEDDGAVLKRGADGDREPVVVNWVIGEQRPF